MDGRERAVMARVHGLQHLQALRTSYLTQNDSVWTHTQGILHQFALCDLSLPFDIGRTSFQTNDMLLTQLQLSCILNGHDSFGIGDKPRQDVQHRRLARTRTTGNENVQTRLNDSLHQLANFRGKRPLLGQMVQLQWVLTELSNRERGPVDREWWNDGIHAGAVGKPGIHHGHGLINTPTDSGDDFLDDLHQVGVVVEGGAGQFQLAGAFDIGNNRIAQAFNLAIPYVCSGGTSLYAALITRGAIAATPFTAVTDLQLIVYVERN